MKEKFNLNIRQYLHKQTFGTNTAEGKTEIAAVLSFLIERSSTDVIFSWPLYNIRMFILVSSSFPDGFGVSLISFAKGRGRSLKLG